MAQPQDIGERRAKERTFHQRFGSLRAFRQAPRQPRLSVVTPLAESLPSKRFEAAKHGKGFKHQQLRTRRIRLSRQGWQESLLRRPRWIIGAEWPHCALEVGPWLTRHVRHSGANDPTAVGATADLLQPCLDKGLLRVECCWMLESFPCLAASKALGIVAKDRPSVLPPKVSPLPGALPECSEGAESLMKKVRSLAGAHLISCGCAICAHARISCDTRTAGSATPPVRRREAKTLRRNRSYRFLTGGDLCTLIAETAHLQYMVAR